MPEPGLYEKTAAGGFTLGRPGSEPFGADHDPLVRALEAVGPVETTQNLRGKRWSKLAINCAISSLGTIAGERLGSLVQSRRMRRLGLEIMTEAVAVARRERVKLEKVSGTIDLECGSTTNNLDRQKQVSFTITHFVTANRWIAKRASKIGKLEDLKGKTIVSTAGTTNIKQITEINGQKNLGMNIISANGHPEAFQMVETGRAVAFVMDDILLYSLAAQSRSPKDYEISSVALSVEPYGIMLRRDDPAFKKVVDGAMTQIMKSGQINAIYDKWFQKPIPPKNITLNVPMSEPFKKVMRNPTDSGDPKDYQ
jgi:hypothetical protein